MIRALILCLLATPALAQSPTCAPAHRILKAIEAAGRTVLTVSDSSEVERGVSFLERLTGKVASPAPDRIYFLTYQGRTAVMFGSEGKVCPPVPLSHDLARDFQDAIFAGPRGEDI